MVPLSLVTADAGDDATLAALRPSEYTAALIRVLRERAAWVRGAAALEIGSGSGVVLAAMAELAAAAVCGVDIEGAAVAAGAVLLGSLGYGDRAELRRGDMWRPVLGRRFDLIAANLPQFPMAPVGYGGRLPSWSSGGPSGRALLDRFVAGLADHLTAGGRAVLTHNACIGLERTRALAAQHGLAMRIAHTALVSLPAEKLELMTRSILAAEQGRTIHRYGPYAFAEMHVVEIGAAAALG